MTPAERKAFYALLRAFYCFPRPPLTTASLTDNSERQFEHAMMRLHQAVRDMDEELFDADPNCDHDIKDAPGGGIKCSKCRGWFCY